jgi:GT2 family glycosyltransferase
MQLSIIIVNWKSKDYLRKCVRSILAETTRVEYEVIVIDAASFDGSREMIEHEFPGVKFIQSDKNLGFARANNEAYSVARGRSVLFLNPDTELNGPAIDMLHDHLWILPDVGIIGCKLLNTDRSVQTSCIQSLPTISNQILNSEFLRTRFPNSRLWGNGHQGWMGGEPVEVDAVSGACMLLKREVFDEVNLFSSDYFMYTEDVDLCFKVKQTGRRVYCIPSVEVVHHGGSSSGQAQSGFATIMMCESVSKFLRKTRGGVYSWGYRLGMCMSALCRLSALMTAGLFAKSARRSELNSSKQKWSSVLRWAFNLEGWVRRY